MKTVLIAFTQVFEKSRLCTELGNAVYCAPNCTAALSHLGVYPGEIGGVVNNGVSLFPSNLSFSSQSVRSDFVLINNGSSSNFWMPRAT